MTLCLFGSLELTIAEYSSFSFFVSFRSFQCCIISSDTVNSRRQPIITAIPMSNCSETCPT
jgi:hypothetical protein